MAVEVGQALIASAKAVIVADSSLQTTVGLSAANLSKRIHYVEAHEDPGPDAPKEFFIAHEVDLDYSGWPDLDGRYMQTINDYGDNAALVTAVAKRLKELLIERRLTPPDGEFSACRVWPMGSGPLPTGDSKRWQHVLVWRVSLFAKSEVGAVLAR